MTIPYEGLEAICQAVMRERRRRNDDNWQRTALVAWWLHIVNTRREDRMSFRDFLADHGLAERAQKFRPVEEEAEEIAAVLAALGIKE